MTRASVRPTISAHIVVGGVVHRLDGDERASWIGRGSGARLAVTTLQGSGAMQPR
jgi:hypothetical protein